MSGNNATSHSADSKEAEAMQQNPSAPPMGPSPALEVETMRRNPSAPAEAPAPMGPPPTYTEAVSSSPYPPMPTSAVTTAPYPTKAPYPLANTAMPLPEPTIPATAPYPVDDSVVPQPTATVTPVNGTYSQPMGFTHNSLPPTRQHYQEPIVHQPSIYTDHEYVHPKTTYVVLEDRRRRRNDDDDCSCTDWAMCCLCCVESCRAMLICLECIGLCAESCK